MNCVRQNRVLARYLITLPLLWSFAAVAQDAAPTPAGGDSVEYFIQQHGIAASAHPSRSGVGDHGQKSPLELWSGPNDSFLRMTVKSEMIYGGQDSSWFGQDEANLGATTSGWWETSIKPGATASYFSSSGDEFYGELNFVGASTHDIDAAGSNVGFGDTSDIRVENAYIGWRSGTRWGDLGKDFLDVSIGRQQYVAGNGFLFFSQSSNGGKRGGYWLGEHRAAAMTGIVQVNYNDLAVDLIYLVADDQAATSDPDNNTKVGGVTLDYALGDLGGIGGGYYSVSSKAEPRDGMDIIDVRFNITPFQAYMPDSVLAPLSFEGEYVNEDNGDALDADGWYLSGQYTWKDAPWSPSLTYRYSAFEGGSDSDGTSNNYDPLFYGFYDWGYWYQGEVLGEYVLSNSNLNTSMVRLSADPLDSLHLNLFYFNFELDDAQEFGVQSTDFASEWNLTADWTANDFLLFSLVGAYVNPDDGATQYTGGNDDWSYYMLYASFSFK